jgi:hypothetical protein
MENNKFSTLLFKNKDNNLTQIEIDILVGTILGDGHIIINKNRQLSFSYGYSN